jgi:hypothetical protein
MRTPLTAAVLLGGHLLLAFVPTSAHAAVPPGGPAAAGTHGRSSYDDHYRCMYHCEERGYGRDGHDRAGAGSRPGGD